MSGGFDDERLQFDDDRLLAFALGLDDDAELIAAAAADDALRRRLDAMQTDVTRIGAGVRAAVPPPDDAYADLSDPRWARLQEFFVAGAEAPARSRSRRGRWLRVLAPAAAVVLALAIGVTVIQRQSADRAASTARSAKSADSYGLAGGAPATAPTGDVVAQFHQQLEQFALVVIAKARVAHGVFQQFVVVRIFKGDSPNVVRLRVADQPADAGRLHLLLLRPTAAPSVSSTESTGSVGPSVSTSPAPAPAGTGIANDVVTAAQPVIYAYNGQEAVARELPAGTDAASVLLP